MRRREDPYFIPGADDDDAQLDGDVSPLLDKPAQFVPGGAGLPWLRSPLPPWHLWGGTQTLTQGPVAPGARTDGNTLARVKYRRPESWNWWFSAKLLAAQLAGATETVTVQVHFDLILGVGRSQVLVEDFETLQWQYGGPGNVTPLGVSVYSTSTVGVRSFADTAGVIVRTGPVLKEVTAQDMTLSCRIVAFNGGFPITSPVIVEVSGHFAPVAHVRPDWFQDAPIEVVFAGAEVGGS